MKKQEQIKKIMQEMLSHKLDTYTRQDIDDIVLIALNVRDQRTYDRWFHFLWKMQYLIQPEPEIYTLNYGKICVEFEMKKPEEIDPAQRRLNSE